MWDQDKFNNAWDYAVCHHAGQTVPGTTTPYISHVAKVTMETMTALQIEVVDHPTLAVTCALLHDIIEDTEVNFEQVAIHFGLDVARGVHALTKNSKINAKKERMQDSLNRILDQPIEIGMVKLADRITNLAIPPAHWDLTKINYYHQESQLIHQHLHLCHQHLADRLLAKIANYEQYCC